MISLARYSDLLAQPALRSAIVASVLGRLPIGITGLAILMLAQDTSGSFGRGGAVAACYVAGIPFFKGTLYGTLFWSAVLFGGFELMRRRWPSLQPAHA